MEFFRRLSQQLRQIWLGLSWPRRVGILVLTGICMSLIIGVAYWFPHLGSVSSALLFDYDAQKFEHLTTAPVRAYAVHALVNF